MRAKLVFHSDEWATGEYQPPPALANKDFLTVWHLDRETRTDRTAMKVNRGTGVWDESGHLLFCLEKAADLRWSRNSSGLYSLENRFGPCQERPGVRHMLKRYESDTFHVVAETELCVPMGGVEYLVINHSGKKCLATWLDQTQWGYVIIDLQAMTQLPAGFYHASASLAPPGFSLDDAWVVACNRFQSGWWTDVIDDYWDSPSPGGLRKVGTISVQDIASNAISHHDVIVQLPVGWIPDRPTAAEWNMIWGPQFTSERTFRIWLPDDSIETLTLPLPRRIEITRPLATKRKWLD